MCRTSAWPSLTDTVRRPLSALGDHVLTADLQHELARCRRALIGRGDDAAADAIQEAAGKLAASIGVLHARGTRVPAPA